MMFLGLIMGPDPNFGNHLPKRSDAACRKKENLQASEATEIK